MTSGVAAAAYAGIPVTHRGRASAVALVTAHEDPSKEEDALDWGALASFPGTLVFYMGVRTLPALTASLIEAGRPGHEPAAIVARGTFPDQQTVLGTLATIAAAADDARVAAPAVTVIGEVAALGAELAWWEPGPLAGTTVAVTRARAQLSELAGRLRRLGAEVLEAPSIRIVPTAAELPAIDGFDLVCLTSPNGVALLFERLAGRGEDARALAGCVVAAIGPGTARALREHGVIADVVPERFVAEGLVDALAGVEVERALIARAAGARDVLPDALRARGAEVVIVEIYETHAEPVDAALAPALAAADYITRSPHRRRCGRIWRARRRGRRRGSCRSGRSRAAHCASMASNRTSRRRATTSTASSRRSSPTAIAAGRARGPRDDPGGAAMTWASGTDVPLITFLSDYGPWDEFVGVCHAVMARRCPRARIIDIGHGVARHDVRAGALALDAALRYCPPGVHLAVVDPGVGGVRRALAVRVADGDRYLVGPDNGLLAVAAEAFGGVVEAVDVGDSPECLRPISATFHGRDVFAPVAAALADGVALAALGEGVATDTVATLELPRAHRHGDAVIAHVLTVDVYGNVSLDATPELADAAGLEPGARVVAEAENGSAVGRLARTFGDVPPGELLAYRDARGTLALAVNGGSAAALLDLRPDDEVRLRAR